MRVILLNYFSFLFLFFFLLESFIRKQEPYVQTIVGRSSEFCSIFLVIFSFPFRSFSFLRKKKKIANSLYKTRLVVSEIRKHTREEGHIVLIQSFIKRKTKRKKTKKKEKRKKKPKKRRIGIRLCNVHFRL